MTTKGIMKREPRGRNPIDRVLNMVYWYLDLFGADGRPSHTKVLSTWGFFLALGMEVWWVVHLAYRADVQNFQDVITWPFVALVTATLALAFGRDTFKAALRMRNGSNGGGQEMRRSYPDEREPEPS